MENAAGLEFKKAATTPTHLSWRTRGNEQQQGRHRHRPYRADAKSRPLSYQFQNNTTAKYDAADRPAPTSIGRDAPCTYGGEQHPHRK